MYFCHKSAMSVLNDEDVRGSSVNALLGVPRQPRAGAFFCYGETLSPTSLRIYTPRQLLVQLSCK